MWIKSLTITKNKSWKIERDVEQYIKYCSTCYLLVMFDNLSIKINILLNYNKKPTHIKLIG